MGGFFDSVLPVMLSSKLLPEMEMDDNSKRDQLLQGMQNLPIATQIDKLKVILSTLMDHTPCLYFVAPLDYGFLFRLELI